MIVQKGGNQHKHKFNKRVTKIVPVRREGLTVAHDTIMMWRCTEGDCKEVRAYDLQRDIK